MAEDDASASSMARKASRVEEVKGFDVVTGQTHLVECKKNRETATQGCDVAEFAKAVESSGPKTLADWV